MPLRSWKLGRVGGIDLFLHPTFLLVPFYLLSLGADAWVFGLVALVFGCVVLHELGHAMMARRYGIGTAYITLTPIGGIARLDRMPRASGPELLIALAGPAVNLAIAAALWAAIAAFGPALGSGPLAVVLVQMLWINVGLMAFNMLPVFPMDGGRVLRALLSTWLGRPRATTIAANLGKFIAAVAGLYFLAGGMLLKACLAAFIYAAAAAELRAVRREGGLDGGDGTGSGWPAPPPGYRWVSRGDGTFRLAPVVVTVGPYPFGPRTPWR